MKKNQNKRNRQAVLISQLETVKVPDNTDLLLGTIKNKLKILVSHDTNIFEKINIINEVKCMLIQLLYKYKSGKYHDGIFLFSEDLEKAGQFINKLSCDEKVLKFIKLALENHDDPNFPIPNLDNIMDKIDIDEIPLIKESRQEEVNITSASYNLFRNIIYGGIPTNDKDMLTLKAAGL